MLGAAELGGLGHKRPVHVKLVRLTRHQLGLAPFQPVLVLGEAIYLRGEGRFMRHSLRL